MSSEEKGFWHGLCVGAAIAIIIFTTTFFVGDLRTTPSGTEYKDAPCDSVPAIWVVTAYCPCELCCGRYSDGITASGRPATGFLVAAPPDIPFGTFIAIPGYADGWPVQVLDRGGAIQGNKLDVFFEDKDGISGHQRALNWGRQELEVKFLVK